MVTQLSKIRNICNTMQECTKYEKNVVIDKILSFYQLHLISILCRWCLLHVVSNAITHITFVKWRSGWLKQIQDKHAEDIRNIHEKQSLEDITPFSYTLKKSEKSSNDAKLSRESSNWYKKELKSTWNIQYTALAPSGTKDAILNCHAHTYLHRWTRTSVSQKNRRDCIIFEET